MKRSLIILTLALAVATQARAAANGEYILLVGGPSLKQWEQYKSQPHDHWWANFIRAARIRTEQLRAQLGPDANITWMVYKQGYVDRAKQENQDLVGYVNSVADKFHLNLVYFQNGSDVINYLNAGPNRETTKVSGFEYFGHSNKACFMFDYSSNVDSSAKSWLHENELNRLKRNDFARNAYARSWGCHTGESMAKKWYVATGVHMIGVVGKTQYMLDELPVLASQSDKWVN